jgi:FkbM family methyltransferase
MRNHCAIPSFAQVIGSILGHIACYKKGDIVCNTIRSTLQWEAGALDALTPYITPDTIMVDVGSNVGWYAFLAASRNISVVAFEPFQYNLAIQNATRCMHPRLASRITLHPFGLSDQALHCSLHQQPAVNFGDTHTACDVPMREAFTKNGYVQLGESNMYRLDDIVTPALANARKVMKIDIEGHEYEMLSGARTFLCHAHAPKAVYMEVFQLAYKKKLAVDLLTSCGYTLVTSNLAEPNYLFELQRPSKREVQTLSGSWRKGRSITDAIALRMSA